MAINTKRISIKLSQDDITSLKRLCSEVRAFSTTGKTKGKPSINALFRMLATNELKIKGHEVGKLLLPYDPRSGRRVDKLTLCSSKVKCSNCGRNAHNEQIKVYRIHKSKVNFQLCKKCVMDFLAVIKEME